MEAAAAVSVQDEADHVATPVRESRHVNAAHESAADRHQARSSLPPEAHVAGGQETYCAVHPGDAGAGSASVRSPLLESAERAKTVSRMLPWEWSVDDVQRYLAQVGLSELQGAFLEHNVNGLVLLSLSEEDMKNSLGVWKFGPRRQLSLELQEFRSWYNDRHTKAAPLSPQSPVRSDDRPHAALDVDSPKESSPRSPVRTLIHTPPVPGPDASFDARVYAIAQQLPVTWPPQSPERPQRL